MATELHGLVNQQITDLLALSAVESDVLVAALNSIAGAMARVAPDRREDLQKMVAEFMAEPGDKDTVARLGRFLQAMRLEDQ